MGQSSGEPATSTVIWEASLTTTGSGATTNSVTLTGSGAFIVEGKIISTGSGNVIYLQSQDVFSGVSGDGAVIAWDRQASTAWQVWESL